MRRENLALLALFLLATMTFSLAPTKAFIYPDGSVDSKYEDFGPRLDRLQVIMYPGLDAMWTGLQNGEIDVADWPLTAPWLTTFTTPPYNETIQVTSYDGGYRAHSRTYVGGTPEEAAYVGSKWEGLCNQVGLGDNSWYSFENAHPQGFDFGDGQNMTIRYGWSETAYPQHLNPLYSGGYWDAEVMSKIYDTLGHRDPYTLSWKPYLIENWTMGTWNNGTQVLSKVKITLRPDIMWADGLPLTIEDVIYSLDEVSDDLVNAGYPPPWSWAITSLVQGAKILDPYNVEILFSVNNSLAESWTLGGFYIIPKHIWEPIIHSGDPTAFAPDPNVIGSGPWRYVSMTPSQSLVMVANKPGSVVTTDQPGAVAVTSPRTFNYYPVDIQAYEKSYLAKFFPGSDLNFTVRLNNLYKNGPMAVDKYVTIKKTYPTTVPNKYLNGTLTNITSSTLGIVLAPDTPHYEFFTVDDAYAGMIQINVTIVYQTAPFTGIVRTIIMNQWITLKEDIGLILMGSPGFPTPDCKLDGKDITVASRAYGTKPGDIRWSPVADVTGDYKIDGKDITRIAKRFYWPGGPWW